VTGERKIGICARANVVDVVPCQPAVFPFQRSAGVEKRNDLKWLEEAAPRTVLAHKGLRIGCRVALDDTMPNRILEYLAQGANDLVDGAVGKSSAAALVSATGARVDVVLHQRGASGSRLLDGIALTQQRIDHVVDVTRRDHVDGFVSARTGDANTTLATNTPSARSPPAGLQRARYIPRRVAGLPHRGAPTGRRHMRATSWRSTRSRAAHSATHRSPPASDAVHAQRVHRAVRHLLLRGRWRGAGQAVQADRAEADLARSVG
jgi:hypothetical protein